MLEWIKAIIWMISTWIWFVLCLPSVIVYAILGYSKDPYANNKDIYAGWSKETFMGRTMEGLLDIYS